jgi:site-specific recombinase XerD
MAKFHANQRLFPITRQRLWQIIREHGNAAGTPQHKLRTNRLKHTIAILSIKLAGSENVRQYLGNKSLSCTGAYLKVNDTEASAAVAKALAD